MSTTEYSPAIYTGDPSQVFINAIAAKVEGHLTDAQFDAVMNSASAIPAQTVEAHAIAGPNGRPAWSVLGVRIHNPIVLGIVVLLGLALVITILVCIAIGLMGVVTWVKANAAMVGGVLIAIIFVVVFFTALILKARGQQPIHINNYTNEA